MAIVLKKVKQNNYQDLTIDSNKIIGIMGQYKSFISLFNISNIFLIGKECDFKKDVYETIKDFYNKDDLNEKIVLALNIFELKEDFLSRKISALSNCEKRIVQYIELLLTDKKIIIIDDPYLYLDYFYKKKFSFILNSLIRSNKTIIIGSSKSDDIYSLCSKLLLINEDSIVYGDINNLFKDKELLLKYGIVKPMIMEFVDLCHEKGKNIHYTNDIRDLIKEVYKNV